MASELQRSSWSPALAAHLFARAGFGCTPQEANAAAARPLAEVVDELLDFTEATPDFGEPDWATGPEAAQRPDPAAMKALSEEERQQRQREQRREHARQIQELRAWWLYRMRYSTRPLQEKLTLFWHGHFATSMEKVRSPYAMWRQNQTLRAGAAGSFEALVREVAQDPAMLIYLDNAQSRARHPNENFARELLELFTLGEGHYAEEDIREGARALTGWSIEQDRFAFVFRRPQHDAGSKTFLGETGPLDGYGVCRLAAGHPACARHLARKLWLFFAGTEPTPSLLDALAKEWSLHKGHVKLFLRSLFLSDAFYARKVVRAQIKSPVQWLVGTARALDAPLPSADICAMILRALGQELFAPPNVKGWDGGRAWITATTLYHRYNFAGLLVKGGAELGLKGPRMERIEGMEPGAARGLAAAAHARPVVDAERVLPPQARGSRREAYDHLCKALFGYVPSPTEAGALADYINQLPEPSAWTEDRLRDALHTMMSTPLYQLC